MVWPEWWDWELDLNLDHLREQMVRRGFSETELREMLERAAGFREDDEFGRWVIDANKDQDPWEIVVEPQFKDRVLLVITAYKKEPL